MLSRSRGKCNKTCIQNTFPKIRKTAKIVPIFKKCDRKNPGIYRPIGIFGFLSEELGKLFQKGIVEFCHKNEIIENI